MNKNYIITAIIILLILLIGGVFLFIKLNKEVPETIIQPETKEPERLIGQPIIYTQEGCDSMPDGYSKEECYKELKFAEITAGSKNQKECLEFKDLKYRNDCIYELARTNKDITHCKRISDHKKRESCIGEVGINQRDKKFCDEFRDEPYEYQECIDRIDAFIAGDKISAAGALNTVEEIDINECAKIKTLEYSKLCIGNAMKAGKKITGESVRPEAIEAYKNFMLYRIAGTIEECGQITLTGAKDACINKINNPEFKYFDYDNDGINDDKELWFSTDPGNSDTDGDGLSDYQEVLIHHTDPTNKDTDNDGVEDGQEVEKNTHPNKSDSDSDGLLDGADDDPLNLFQDNDGDRLSNDDEKKWGTDPNKKDTDGDGVSDYVEIKNSVNPLGEGWQQDTDQDGLIDVDEIFYLTDRLNPDTDGDGVLDGEEVENLTNPFGEGDMDFDNDGLSDKDEERYGTNPSVKDTNNDGLNDLKAIQQGVEAVSYDTDGDSLSNIYEISRLKTDPLRSDTDNDILADGEEMQKYRTNPLNPDTDGDGFLDGEEVKNGYNPLGEGRL